MKGFTLIELLVVVLIIGILSAIALPKYQIAIGKTRTTDGIRQLQALVNAQEAYFLTNGSYTNDITVLDVEVKNSKFYTYLCASNRTCAAHPRMSNIPNLEFHMQMNPTGTSVNHLGKRWCRASLDSEIEQAICSNWGPLDATMGTAAWYYYLVQ